MKCIHCGKRLALLRKLTGGEFCSDAHRRAWQLEQEKLALGRLRDAQMRLTGFTPPPEPVTHQTVPPGLLAHPANSAGPTVDEEMRGFLPQAPEPHPILTFCRTEASPSLSIPSAIVPEREVRWQASPSPSLGPPWVPQPTSIDIPSRQCAEPAIGFAWVPSHPSSTVHRLHFRGIPEAGSVQCPVPDLVASPQDCAIASLVTAPALLQNAPPATIIAIPSIVLNRAPGIPTPEQESVPQPALDDPARHPVTPVSQPFRRGVALRPAALSPVLENQWDILAETSEEPDLASLFPAHQPGIAERHPSVRRVRPRELFFPLPRLGNLPSLAAQVAGNSVQTTAYQGTSGKRWLPDRIPMSFRLAVADNRDGRGVNAFDHLEPASRAPHLLPHLIDAREPQLAGPGLRPAGETGSDYLLAGRDCPGAIVPIGVGQPFEPRVDSHPTPPPFPLCALELSLRPPSVVPEEPPMVRAGVPIFHLSPQCEAVLNNAPLFAPAFPCAAPAPPCLSVGLVDQMVQIRVSQPSDGCLQFSIEPELLPSELLSVAGAISAVAPVSQLAGEFYLPEDGTVFPLSNIVAQLGSYPSPTPGELAPLWADLPKLLPRTAFAVVEDSEMREAARAFSAVMARERSAPWLSKFHLPQFSVQFNGGDLKWLMMSVPVVLLLGVYTLTERGSSTGVSHLPPVDRDVAREVAEEPATPPIPDKELPPIVAQATLPKTPEHDPVAAGKKTPSGTVPKTSPAPKHSPDPGNAFSGNAVLVHASNKTDPSAKTDSDTGMLSSVRQSILRRAAVSMSDDFRAGLGDWEGKGNWSKTWSYDDAGFLRAGPLALYKPSLPLTDYRMEFLGQVEKRAIGWAFRAVDLDNYYAAKVVIPEGPLPRAYVEHWSVINGKESAHSRRPVPFLMQRDSFYKFRMDVSGNGFTLSIQGQVADHWSDSHLKSGGIGFFSSKGEQSRLRWVELSHQYDFLGRVCAFLAPYGVPAKDGSR